MGLPAAKEGDQVEAVDIHIVLVPSESGEVPTPLPHPFSGVLTGNLSEDVKILELPAAMVESTAENEPPHIPTPPGIEFQDPPTDDGTVLTGSATVFINGRPAARAGDTVLTCNDPEPLPVGTILAESTVLIG